ncbi:hypothetical protein J6E39_08025 [bacterium]|nr:hypothetical protein [bacterium]
MNVSFNTNNYANPSLRNNRNTKYNSLNSSNSAPHFTGAMSQKYDEAAQWIGKNFTRRLIDCGPMGYLSDKFKNANVFQHCMTIEALITSGLYMFRTLKNDKLDEERRKTLTVNQGLTFLISTLGAYTLDGVINGKWEKQSARFISNQLKDNKSFYNEFLEKNKKIDEENKALKKAAKASGQKPKLKPSVKALDMLYGNKLYKNMIEKDQSMLNTKVKGFSAVKSMIVFGLVYRYLVPVVVTKPANKLCEMYLENKKKKQTENTKQA